MYDMLGVEIKKGDLLLNISGTRGSFAHGVCVAVGFTKKSVVVGAPVKVWSSTRKPVVVPYNNIVINHMWDKALTNTCKTRYGHPSSISKVVAEFKITPNRDIRLPTKPKTDDEYKEDLDDNLENI